MSRAKLISWRPKQKLSLVAIENCGGTHYWARLAQYLEHEVMPIPPRQVKPFRTGQKTDSNDAIAVASRSPNSKPARILSAEQQGTQSVGSIREHLGKQKLQLSNQMRGLLEFGLVINKSIKERIPEILEDADDELSAPMRKSLFQMMALYYRLEDDFEAMDKELIQLSKSDNDCQRLMKLEGVGPITSIKLKSQIGHGEYFNSGRQAVACIGLTPKQHSSVSKVNIGSVGKNSCDKPLRSSIFLGRDLWYPN
ncbi:MAG: IS110 family transposase [Psychrobium sp.]|nr:IS110 family transposase [Psychrobium sp.]